MVMVFTAVANETLLYLKNDTYELEISEMDGIVSYEKVVSDKYSLEMVANSEAIIKRFLQNENVVSDLNQDKDYKISLTSNAEIRHIREEVLNHFLKVSKLQVETSEAKEERLELSYLSDKEPKDGEIYPSNNTVSLNIQLEKRIILSGYSLENVVDNLNEGLEQELFVAGKSNIEELPRIHFLKRKLTSKPQKYLRSKGFEIKEVEVLAREFRIVEIN